MGIFKALIIEWLGMRLFLSSLNVQIIVFKETQAFSVNFSFYQFDLIIFSNRFLNRPNRF